MFLHDEPFALDFAIHVGDTNDHIHAATIFSCEIASLDVVSVCHLNPQR